MRSCRQSDLALLGVYAELVVAYARIVRTDRTGVRLAVMDHLVERVAQARDGELTAPLADIVDRLHGEVTAALASA